MSLTQTALFPFLALLAPIAHAQPERPDLIPPAVSKVVNGQLGEPIPITPAVRNIGRLETTLTISSSVLAPGEIMAVTVSIRNPTSTPLEVPHPFWQRAADFDFKMKDMPGHELWADEEGYSFYAPHPHSDILPRDTTPNLVLQPGETISRTLPLTEDSPDTGLRSHVLMAPDHPGNYRLLYSYDKRTIADFRVARPILEHFQSAMLPASGDDAPNWANACVLNLEGRRLVMLKAWDDRELADDVRRAQENDPAWAIGAARFFRPYERLAEIDGPVLSFELTSSPIGDLDLRWRAAGDPIPNHSIQRKGLLRHRLSTKQ